MRLKLLTLCWTASLLLCVATSVLWLRSYSQEDMLSFARARIQPLGRPASTSIYFGSNRGVLCLGRNVVVDNGHAFLPKEGLGWTSRSAFPVPWGRSFLESLHFSLNSFDNPGQRMTELYFPHWAVIVVVLPLASFAIWRTASRLRRKPGFDQLKCGACGYDLRATPDRCPECGEVPAARPPHNQPMQRTGAAV